MKTWLGASVLVLAGAAAVAAEAPPEWGYPAIPPGYQAPPESAQPIRLPGSDKSYTAKEIGDAFNPPDWNPGEHPPMPDIVAHGKKPDVNACALCHLTTGAGHPESANIRGLPAGYFEEQLHEFRDGNRASMLPGRSNNMIRFAKNMTDDEIKQAAAYFSSMKPIAWTKVVETATVPKTYVGEGNMRFAAAGPDKEPIGKRIIELPDNEERAKARDPHSPFVAYVPEGSIKGRRDAGHHGGQRQDHPMLGLSRRGLQGHRQRAAAGGTFGDLSVPATQRHPARNPPRQRGGPDAASCRQTEPGRHDRAGCFHGLADALSGASRIVDVGRPRGYVPGSVTRPGGDE
jgi:cytochrome c553